MLPGPGRPTVDVCCSGGDAGKLHGQSLRSRVRGGPGLGGRWRRSPPRLHCQAPASRQLPALCLRRPVPSAWQEAAAGAAPPGEASLAPIPLVPQPWLSGSAEGRAVTPPRGCRRPQMLLRAEGSPCPMPPGTAGLLTRGARELPPHG